MSVSDEKLKKIEQEIMSSMQGEGDLEKLIESAARDVASKLLYGINRKAVIEFIDVVYTFKYKEYGSIGRQRGIFIVATYKSFDEVSQEFVDTIGKINAEIDNNFSLSDNIKAAIEAFFRHKTDLIRAGEIDN